LAGFARRKEKPEMIIKMLIAKIILITLLTIAQIPPHHCRAGRKCLELVQRDFY
jgi:hypothetical protein